MLELIGDSARGADFAFVRLNLEGERIVAADASGLERSLVGLTLLEAAAVGGETLAVDALANAIGPVFRASRSPGRIAVAMSGGVDSAVALLKSLPNAIGVTLRRWLDPAKDQSYMLARLDPAKLDRISFPLGRQTKNQTRAEAGRAGLSAAGREESQEACFLAGDDYRSFLERRGLEAQEGSIVDEDGEEVGTHGGYWRFTPGQRKGLGVAAQEPLY